MRRRLLPALALAAVCGAQVFAGAGRESRAATEPVTLKVWWIAGPEHEAWMPPSIESFNKIDKNVQAALTMLGGDEIRINIRTSFASGSGPDISFIWGLKEFLPDMANAGLVLNLDKYYREYGWDKVIAAGREMNAVNGSQYCVPINSDANPIIFYNKKIFSQYNLKPPTSEAELVALCKVLQGKGVGTIAFGVKDQWQAGNVLNALQARYLTPQELESMANAPYKGGTFDVKWDSPGNLKAMSKMREWMVEGVFTKGIEGMDFGEAQSQFLTGKVAMFSSGTWTITTSRQAFGDDVGMFLYPQLDPNIKPIILGGFLDTIVVNAKTKHVEQAVKLVDHLIGKPAMTLYAKAGLLPSRDDMNEELKGILDPFWLDIVQFRKTSGTNMKAIMALYHPAELISLNMQLAQELMLGTKTPAAAAASFNELAQKLRSK